MGGQHQAIFEVKEGEISRIQGYRETGTKISVN
jgi:hypothetical protein